MGQSGKPMQSQGSARGKQKIERGLEYVAIALKAVRRGSVVYGVDCSSWMCCSAAIDRTATIDRDGHNRSR